MRNRWYDPQTGRFLSQDPIGLAGGVNLYAYAGNNPASYSDPFGLCKRPQGKGIGVCIEAYIRAHLMGAGDNRGPQGDGGTSKLSISFTIDPKTGELTGARSAIGKTFGLVRGTGFGIVGTPQSDGHGGWNVTAFGDARNRVNPILGDIDAAFVINVTKDGGVSVVEATHDGYPSYEVWAYSDDGAKQIYDHKEGKQRELYGCCDVNYKDGVKTDE
jgi:hypothetical protein